MTPLIPLNLSTDVGEHGGHLDGFFEPLLGLGFSAAILAVLVVAFLVLRTRCLLPAQPSRPSVGGAAGRTPPSRSSTRTLPTATSPPTTFMERASALSSTVGVDTVRPRSVGRG